jgi:hypothetical protein
MRLRLAFPWIGLLLCCACAAGAADKTDPVSGLPIHPGFASQSDAVHAFQYCGKQARTTPYIANGSPSLKEEIVWYARAIPGAKVFTADGGITTYFTADGASAAQLGDSVIMLVRFAPPLSAAEMKSFGNSPASSQCSAKS